MMNTSAPSYTIFSCRWCPRAFTSTRAFINHKKSEHPIQFADQIRCKKEREKQTLKSSVHVQSSTPRLPKECKLEGKSDVNTTTIPTYSGKLKPASTIFLQFQDFKDKITTLNVHEVEEKQLNNVTTKSTNSNLQPHNEPLKCVPQLSQNAVIKVDDKINKVEDNNISQSVHFGVVDWQSNKIEISKNDVQIPPSPNSSSREDGIFSDATEVLGEQQSHENNQDQKRTRLHKCRFCRMQYTEYNDLLLHEQRHSKSTTFGKTIESPSNTSQMKKGRLACRFCNKRLSSYKSLEDHENSFHTGVKSYKCNYCEEYFATRSQRIRHTNKDHEAPRYCSAADFACVKEFFSSQTKYTDSETTEATVLTKDRQDDLMSKESSTITPSKNQNSSSQYVTTKIIGGNPYYFCTFCHQKFTNLQVAIEHLPKHTKERNYICQYCKKTFRYGRDMRTHQKKSHPTHFKAELREKYSEYNLNSPRPRPGSSISKSKRSKTTSTKKNLRHAPVFQEKKRKGRITVDHLPADKLKQYGLSKSSPWSDFFVTKIGKRGNTICVCRICKKTFGKNAIAVDHVNTHTGQKPYGCRYCDSVFGYRRNMISHEQNKHLDNDEEQHYKSNLNTTAKAKTTSNSSWETYDDFSSDQSESDSTHSQDHNVRVANQELSKYIVSQPFNGKQVHVCSFCKHIFPSLTTALIHVTTHTGEPQKSKKSNESYTCTICNFTSSYVSSLKRHMMLKHIQSEEKSSNERFASQGQRQKKRRRTLGCTKTRTNTTVNDKSSPYVSCGLENGSVVYICNFCKKNFASISSAISHTTSHTGHTPYQCTCGKSFSYNSSLLRHRKTAHSNYKRKA